VRPRSSSAACGDAPSSTRTPDRGRRVLDDDRPPRTRRQLARTAVGALTGGKVLSTIAVWTTNVAGAILVFDLTGSALLVGLVSVAQFTPQLVLTPLTGALADRADRFVQVMVGTAITALGSLLLTFWSLTAGFTVERDAYVMVAAAGLVGLGFAVSGPAMSALLPALVRRSELADALALSSLPIVVARSTGPAIGAALYLTSGPVVTFGLGAVLHVGFIVLLIGIRRRVVVAPRSTTGDADGRVRAGFAYLRRSPRTVVQIVGVGIIGVGTDPITTLTPALAAALTMPAGFVGTLASSFGLGAAVGFVVLSRVRIAVGLVRLGGVGLAVMGAGTLLAGFAPLPALAVLGIGTAGMGMTFALNAFTTLVQADVPDLLRGRVMALWSMAFIGSRPLTALTTGWLTDAFGVRQALVLSAAVILFGAWLTRGSRMLTRPVSRDA
jgi:MFS family permease